MRLQFLLSTKSLTEFSLLSQQWAHTYCFLSLLHFWWDENTDITVMSVHYWLNVLTGNYFNVARCVITTVTYSLWTYRVSIWYLEDVNIPYYLLWPEAVTKTHKDRGLLVCTRNTNTLPCQQASNSVRKKNDLLGTFRIDKTLIVQIHQMWSYCCLYLLWRKEQYL